MTTIRDSGFVLKEGARLLTELKRLHDRLHQGQINLSQATQFGVEQIQASQRSMAAATPPPLPQDSMPPWEVDRGQVTYDSLMKAFDSEKPDALAAYTGLSTTNPATAFLAGEIVSINYNNAMGGEDLRPDVTAKAIECFNKALAGDLDAGLDFLRVKHQGKEANESILTEVARAVGKESKNLSERNGEILRKKTTEFLQGNTSPARFRAEFTRLGGSMGQKL